MGVIFFTLLAVALGCGVGSKARKDKKQHEKRRRQGTVPAGGELFLPEEEMPPAPVQTLSGTFEMPEESLERLEEEFALEAPTSEAAFEAGRYEEALAQEDAECGEVCSNGFQHPDAVARLGGSVPGCGEGGSEANGFSLRDAVIAQAVLERKYN